MAPPSVAAAVSSGAADRLLSFYGNELMTRSGTLASIKSFGSQASVAPSNAVASTVEGRVGSREGRPDNNDVVIDPYELDSSDLESSTESGFDSVDGGRKDLSEPGDSTDWDASGYGESDGDDDDGGAGRRAGGGGMRSRASSYAGGGGSRSRASSAAGFSVRSRGSAAATPDTRSMRSRASFTTIGTGGVSASFKSRASSVRAASTAVCAGAGRDLLSFKRRSMVGGAVGDSSGVGAGASSFKSRASAFQSAAAAAAAGGGSGGTSFRTRPVVAAGVQRRGSMWTRALNFNEADRVAAAAVGSAVPAMSVGGGSSRVTVRHVSTAPNTAKNRLSGKNVRRRLLRRRGWDFDLTPEEIDFHLGRQLPDVLTRPQPTINSEDEEEGGSGGGDDDDDDNDGSLSAGGNEPPSGPAVEAIKTYAKERAPEVLWSERLRSARRTARATGQTVTVRGRLDRKRRRELARKIQKWDNREWFATRKRTPPAPPLHPAVARVIEQWFSLVDDDGSGTLDHSELLAALEASNVPVSASNIAEMIQLMDLDGDGVINWKEFETFFMYEFAAGKNLLSGEYVLPSGVALPFGAMIAKLRRNKLLSDLTEGGAARAKWTQVAENPVHLEDELGMMAAVEMALQEMQNPALARQRHRASKALSRLPPHLRTKSMGRHLERHPEITDKLLRAASIAPLLLNTMKRAASTTSAVVARLASQGSQGSASSAAPSGTSGASSGPAAGGLQGGKGRNVDLNVAAALAAGLEWPVSGANFYNRRARMILRSVCQRPAESLLQSQAAAKKLAAAKAAAAAASCSAAAIAAAAAKAEGPSAAAAPGGDAGGHRDKAGGDGGGPGLSRPAEKAGGAAARSSFAQQAGSRRMPSQRDGMMRFARRRSSRRQLQSESSEGDSSNGGSGSGKARRRSTSSDEVLPWLVNAKRREEEERAVLRAQLQGGRGRSSSSSSNGSSSSSSSGSDSGDDGAIRRSGSGSGAGAGEEEGVWVSPMLRTWLQQEHKLHQRRQRRKGSSREEKKAAAVVELPPDDGGGGRAALQARRGSGSGGLTRRVLERSLNLPPELAVLRETAATPPPLQPVADMPPAPYSPRVSPTTGFAEPAEVAVAAVAPPPLLVVESQAPSVDTPNGGDGDGDGGGEPPSLGPMLPAASPGTAPTAEDKPRKPRRRMRFEDEQDPSDLAGGAGGTDVERSLGCGGGAAADSAGGGISPRPSSLQPRSSLPQRPSSLPRNAISSAGGEAAAAASTGDETPTEDGGGGGSNRSSRGRGFLMQHPLFVSGLGGESVDQILEDIGDSDDGDDGGDESVRPSEGSEAAQTPPEGRLWSLKGGSRPWMSNLGMQELQPPAAATAPAGSGSGVRHWSAVSGGAAPPHSLLRSSGGNAASDGEQRVALRSLYCSDRLYGGGGGGEEPLDEDEAREMMAAMTLELRKDEKLYDIHNGHLLDRPTTSHFRAALAKIRTAASALLQLHSLPPHPEYSGGGSSGSGAADAVHPVTLASLSAGPSFLMPRQSGLVAVAAAPWPPHQARGRRRRSASIGGGVFSVTDPGADAAAKAAAVAGGGGVRRTATGRGRGAKTVKQVANRSRSLLISGVHMRPSVSSVTGSPAPVGGGTGAAAAARRRLPSSPSSRPLAAPQISSGLRGLLYTSVGLSHNPDAFPDNGAQEAIGGGGRSGYGSRHDDVSGGSRLGSAQQSVDQSFLASPAAVAAAAPTEAEVRAPDAGILAAAIDTARTMSRSRPPSRCRSPVQQRSSGGSRPASRAASPVRRSSTNSVPAAALANVPAPTVAAAAPLLPKVAAAAGSPWSCGSPVEVPYDSSATAGVARRAVRGRASPTPAAAAAAALSSAAAAAPTPAPPLSEAWDAHAAAILQRRTAAELVAVHRSYKSSTTLRDGLSPVRGATPDAVARRGAGGGTRSGASSNGGGIGTGSGDGLPQASTSPSLLAAVAADPLLGPIGSSLPDFVPVPGAMPRLQSRYATKRPPLAAASVEVDAAAEVTAVAVVAGAAETSQPALERGTAGAAAQCEVTGYDGGGGAVAVAAADAGTAADRGAVVEELVAGDGDGGGVDGEAGNGDGDGDAAAAAAAERLQGGANVEAEPNTMLEAEGVEMDEDGEAEVRMSPTEAAAPDAEMATCLAAAAAAVAAAATAVEEEEAEVEAEEEVSPPLLRPLRLSVGLPSAEPSEAPSTASLTPLAQRPVQHKRLTAMSTADSDSPSRATSSEWWYDEPHPPAPSVAPSPEIPISPLAAAEDRTLSGRRLVPPLPLLAPPSPLTMDEALALSAFGKPQTPTLARVERAARPAGGPAAEPPQAPPSPLSAAVRAAPTSAAAAPSLASNPYSGGAAGGSILLPAASRLRLNPAGATAAAGNHLQQHHQHRQGSPAVAPMPAPQAHVQLQPPPQSLPLQLAGTQKPLQLSGAQISPRGAAQVSAAVAAAATAKVGAGAGVNASGGVSVSGESCAAAPGAASAPLSGRSRTLLHPLALVPQSTVTGSGEAAEAATTAAPSSPTVPPPAVPAGRSYGHLPALSQCPSPFPVYHPHHQKPSHVYQSHPSPYQQQQHHHGVRNGGGNSSISGGGNGVDVSISGIPLGGGARAAPVVGQPSLLPPLREPSTSSHAPRQPSPPPPPPPPGHNRHSGDLSDADVGATSMAPPVRRRSAAAESLPALPMRIHSQSNIAVHHYYHHTPARGSATAAAADNSSSSSSWPRGRPLRTLSTGAAAFVAAGGAGGEASHPPPRPFVSQRKPAWGNESPPPPLTVSISLPVGSVTAAGSAAAAAFAPAPPTAPLVAPVVSVLADLPDIVTLLLPDPGPPVRTGPTRVRRMDY